MIKMSKKYWVAGAAAVAVVVMLLAAWRFLLPPPQETWPGFEDAKGPAPAFAVEYDQRNFGWRIGDALPVTVFVKQFAGTAVDVNLALDGDFETRGDMQVDSISLPDGGKIYRIRMMLQSFAYKDERTARATLTWGRDGQKGAQESAETKISVRTSRTWDGQPAIQEGKPGFVQGNHLVKVLALGLGSLAVLVVSLVYIRWQVLLLPLPKSTKTTSREEWAKARFDAAWAHIASGDRDPVWFKRITATMRRYLGAEAVLWTRLPDALRDFEYQKQALTVVGLCERVLFKGDVLDEDELNALHVAFYDIVLKRAK